MDLKEQTKAPADTEARTGAYVGNPGIEAGVAPVERAPRPIEAGVDIGHVHLRASDLGKIRDFYVGILGFDVVVEAPAMLFLSAGGYHHHLGFNTWKSADGPPQPDGVTGLHHVALNFSSQAELAEAVGRLVDAGVPLRQLTDHGTHLAVYLSDPDGNDLELAWDRPFEQWRRYGSDDAPPNDGRLELDELLAHRR